MDKNEAHNDRMELEESIKTLIRQYEEKHGLAVTRIKIRRNYGPAYAEADQGFVSESGVSDVTASVEV